MRFEEFDFFDDDEYDEMFEHIEEEISELEEEIQDLMNYIEDYEDEDFSVDGIDLNLLDFENDFDCDESDII